MRLQNVNYVREEDKDDECSSQRIPEKRQPNDSLFTSTVQVLLLSSECLYHPASSTAADEEEEGEMREVRAHTNRMNLRRESSKHKESESVVAIGMFRCRILFFTSSSCYSLSVCLFVFFFGFSFLVFDRRHRFVE